MAGFINVSGNAGTQIGGFMNIAKKVKGVQIAGFLNIADSSDYPIALINIIRNGERSIGLSTDETLTNLVTFRSGKQIIWHPWLGYNGKDTQRPLCLGRRPGRAFQYRPQLQAQYRAGKHGLPIQIR